MSEKQIQENKCNQGKKHSTETDSDPQEEAEEMLDEALKETFPASDPIQLTPPGAEKGPYKTVVSKRRKQQIGDTPAEETAVEIRRGDDETA